MARGISPIVAVVLLIAISIIAATGLYFWTAGIATKQPTPNTPASITAVPIGNGKVLIANLGQTPINASNLQAVGATWDGCEGTGVVPAGQQILCNYTGSGSILVYGVEGVGSASFDDRGGSACSPHCANGQPCASFGNCASGFCDNSGTCQACVADGNCQPAHNCSGSVCRPCAPHCPNGVTCTNGNQCDSDNCNNGTCGPEAPPLGAVHVTSCPYWIGSAGYYYLDSDLTSTSSCVNIGGGASGATLDCYGHSITGTGGDGIYLGSNNFTLKRCVVGGFYNGINIQSSSHSTITGNTMTSCANGAYMQNSDDNTFVGNTVSSNTKNPGYGMEVFGSNRNNISGNTVNSNGRVGILFLASRDNIVAGNTALSNGRPYGGIYMMSSPNNTLADNTACMNAGANIGCDSTQPDGGDNICNPVGVNSACMSSISCGAGCPPATCAGVCAGGVCTGCGGTIAAPGSWTISDDISCGNCNGITITSAGVTLDCHNHAIFGGGGNNGVYLNGVSGATVENCVVRNFNNGISASSTTGSVITANNVYSNDYGITLSSSSNNNLTGNTASINGQTGITLSSSNGNRLTGNTADSNDQYGIKLDGSSGNVLEGNVAGSNYWGIGLQSSNSNNMTSNSLSNGYYGISLTSGSTGNRLTSNIAIGVSEGFWLQNSNGNVITGNTALATNGFSFSASSNNDYSGNNGTSSSYGFYCYSTDLNNDLGGNTCNKESGCESWITSCGLPPACGASIASCCLINAPGTYSLNQNITTTDTCIIITPPGSGATLDCDGHSITSGWTGYGARIVRASGVTIENCTMRHFDRGIHLSGTSGCSLLGNMALENQVGIEVGQSSGAVIKNNRAASNSWAGIFLSSTNTSTIEGNTATLNSEGIYAGSITYNNFTGNNLTGNTNNGIYLMSSSNNNNLTGNTARSNNQYGFRIEGSSSNRLASNTACSNPSGNVYCNSVQTDGTLNVCTPFPGTQCSGSVTCNAGC